MVVGRYTEIENDVLKILTSVKDKSLSNLLKNRTTSLFSISIGFTEIEMLYVFVILEITYNIPLKKIDWQKDNLFTFDGLCNLIQDSLNEKNVL